MNNLHWGKSVPDGQKGLTAANRAAIIRAARAADQHSRSINAIGAPETTREPAMPLEIRSFPLDSAHLDELAGVLRQDQPIAADLASLPGSAHHQLWVGIFNARPVSLLLLEQRDADWWASQLVVHPATRGRGVAAETLRLAARQQPFRCPPALATLAQRAGLAD